MPVGFAALGAEADAASEAAAAAIASAAKPHPFIGVSKQGVAGVVHTTGNADCHAIVCGDAPVETAVKYLADAGLCSRVMVDCSAAADQAASAKAAAARVSAGGAEVAGVILNSYLKAGAQPHPPLDEAPDAAARLETGVSISEPCIDWDTTHAVLSELAAAVKARRAATGSAKANGASGPAAKKRRSR